MFPEMSMFSCGIGFSGLWFEVKMLKGHFEAKKVKESKTWRLGHVLKCEK